jgi:two-component system, NtrC family, sensor kinase
MPSIGKRLSKWIPLKKSGRGIPIATRLTISFLAIIILSSLIFTIAGVNIISNRVITEAQERVRTNLNAAEFVYSDKLDHVTEAARFTAARLFMKDMLNGNITQEYINELVRFKDSEALDVLTITDQNGIVVFRASSNNVGDDQSHDEILSATMHNLLPASGTIIVSAHDLQLESIGLAEQAHIIFVDTPMARTRPETEETSGMMLKAAYPVFDDNGKLIGFVYAGLLLNRNYDIVDEVKQTVFQGSVYKGRDIGTATIFQDDVRISTNVTNKDGSRAIGTRVAQDVYQQVVVNGQQYLGRAFVVNDWYIAAYEPIRDFSGKIIGILYVGLLEKKYLDVKNQTILTFSAITLSGVVLSIIMTILISRNISSSIKRLATASKQLANGNLDAKVSKTSNDELGELADAFNLMATSLKDRDDKIKEFAKKKIMESERLALIGQLSANVAHDLNNPLQGIVTYSYLLLEEKSFSAEVKENLQKIVVQANRCRDIIRGLLDFSRQKKPDKTLCDVNSLLQGCISLVEKQAQFQNIRVTINLDKNMPMVILDPSQVERVFLNLIINAAEAMEGNGQLTLSTQYKRDSDSVEIMIQDTGPGISEENMEKIFEPFFTTKETGHGVGLGLAISYGIVKEHNGSIAVESVLGKGTTFTISFPLVQVTNDAEHGN